MLHGKSLSGVTEMTPGGSFMLPRQVWVNEAGNAGTQIVTAVAPRPGRCRPPREMGTERQTVRSKAFTWQHAAAIAEQLNRVSVAYSQNLHV